MTAVLAFSFDDSEKSQLHLAAPILANAGFSATAFTITERFDDDNYLTEADAKALQNTYGWDIGGHCTTAAGHVDFRTFTEDQLRDELTSIKYELVNRGFRGADLFATPLGVMNSLIVSVASELFSCLRTTVGGGYSPFWSPPVLNPYNLQAHGWDASGGMTAVTFNNLIDAAIAGGFGIILNFHTIAASTSGLSIGSADLKTIVDHAVASGIEVVTISQLFTGNY